MHGASQFVTALISIGMLAPGKHEYYKIRCALHHPRRMGAVQDRTTPAGASPRPTVHVGSFLTVGDGFPVPGQYDPAQQPFGGNGKIEQLIVES